MLVLAPRFNEQIECDGPVTVKWMLDAKGRELMGFLAPGSTQIRRVKCPDTRNRSNADTLKVRKPEGND